MSIIQIVQDISKRITDITNNVEKIKTSQSSNKTVIIQDLRNIKEKIEAMKENIQRQREIANKRKPDYVGMAQDGIDKARDKSKRQQGQNIGNIAKDAHKLGMYSSSDAAKYGTGRPNGGTKQKKKLTKRRTHKKFRG